MSHRAIFKYKWRHPPTASLRPTGEEEEEHAFVKVGEEVWLKPLNARCTSHRGKGTIPSVNSKDNVSVDGMLRNVLDMRKMITATEDAANSNKQVDEAGSKIPGTEVSPETPWRSKRLRCPTPPRWLSEYKTR